MRNFCNKEQRSAAVTGRDDAQAGIKIARRYTKNLRYADDTIKQITSPGWMHESSARTWCTGKTQRDRVEREVGGGDRDGEHM